MAPSPVTAEQVDGMQAAALALTPDVIIFWLLGGLILAGAIFTITRRNLISAVLSLVGTFFGLAATYAMLSAHFLAALQVLVYAGAIMVLFIFVVMVLNRDEIDPWVWRGWFGKVLIAIPSAGYLVIRLARYLAATPSLRTDAPPESFGTVAAVGHVLFTDYLFAFEATSVMLLIAVIGAVVVARTPKQMLDAQKAPKEEPVSSHAESHG